MPMSVPTRSVLVPGRAAGRLVHSDLGLSFMGGVDPNTGVVIDSHHPLRGEKLAGCILAIPSGRGSCAGSLVIFELLLNGNAPAALIFQHKETILTLGVLLAEVLFGCGIPVITLEDDHFLSLPDGGFADIDGDRLTVAEEPGDVTRPTVDLPPLDLSGMGLTPADLRCLAGDDGEAARIAMEIILRTARMEGAAELVTIEKAHIDGCFYQGPAGLAFALRLNDLGARVRVPTTMNALCVDRGKWRGQGVADTLGVASETLADAYLTMGAIPSYTCAPYLLPDRPDFGQQIAWGESNAVVFANSVLGARTLKYPDYLDILAAITGRAPAAGCHLDNARQATLEIDVVSPHNPDDAYFATLGYLVGKLSPNDIPLVTGLERLSVTQDDLKTFGAAFATTSAVAMFHILGVTPEALSRQDAGRPARRIAVTADHLRTTWRELNSAQTPDVDLVALGNPHFSVTEIAALAGFCGTRVKAHGTALIVTCGRDVFSQAELAGYVGKIRAFGGTFLNDTCWCLIGAPVVSKDMGQIATNSGKYAHYGPAAVGRAFHLASLERCAEAACTGVMDMTPPDWTG